MKRSLVPLYVLLVFLSGIMVGVVSYRLYSAKSVTATPPNPQPKVKPEEWRKHVVEEMRTRLALDSVEIVRARAEQWTNPPRFDVVTARAVAALPKLLTWAMPLVAEGGEVLAMKGSSAVEEIEAAASELRRWGARAEIVTSSVPGSSVTTVVRVVRDSAAGLGWDSSSVRSRRRGHA